MVMIMNDLDLPYFCPLIEENFELDPDYLKATYLCWKRLIEDPLIRDFVLMDCQDRAECGLSPDTVYPKTREEKADADSASIETMLAELAALAAEAKTDTDTSIESETTPSTQREA